MRATGTQVEVTFQQTCEPTSLRIADPTPPLLPHISTASRPRSPVNIRGTARLSHTCRLTSRQRRADKRGCHRRSQRLGTRGEQPAHNRPPPLRPHDRHASKRRSPRNATPPAVSPRGPCWRGSFRFTHGAAVSQRTGRRSACARRNRIRAGATERAQRVRPAFASRRASCPR